MASYAQRGLTNEYSPNLQVNTHPGKKMKKRNFDVNQISSSVKNSKNLNKKTVWDNCDKLGHKISVVANFDNIFGLFHFLNSFVVKNLEAKHFEKVSFKR